MKKATVENDYGITVSQCEDFTLWNWECCNDIFTDAVQKISIDAAEVVMGELEQSATLYADWSAESFIVSAEFFDGRVSLSKPFLAMVKDWIETRCEDEFILYGDTALTQANAILADLEAAVAMMKDTISRTKAANDET